jgi:hypothetical protein
MDELIARITARTGLDEATARKAIEIIINFLNRDGPTDLVAEFVAKFPGAEALLKAHGETGKSGFLGGRLSGLLGGMGAVAAFNELTAAGLDMAQVQEVTKEVIAFAKTHVGEELVDRVIADIPGLSQIV